MFRAAQVTVIKGYHFPEPVWQPEALAGQYQFLGDARRLWKMIEEQSKRDLGNIGPFRRRRRQLAIDGIGWLKPIRNPRHRGSAFWVNFFPEHLRGGGPFEYRRALPAFPLQVLPARKRIDVTIEQEDLERWLGEDAIADLKVVPQILIYPVGAVIVQLRLYLEWKTALDLDALANFGRRLDAWPIALHTDRAEVEQMRGVFRLFDHLAGLVHERLVKSPGALRGMPGYYLVYNLQGPWADLDVHEAGLERLLSGRLEEKRLPASLAGAGDSLIAVDRRQAILYADPELKRRRVRKEGPEASILSGRRFLRQKFLTTVELAYITTELLRDYKDRFDSLERDLALVELASDPFDRFFNWVQSGIMEAGAYATLVDSVFGIRQRLGEDPSSNTLLWQTVYDRVMAGRDGAELLEALAARSQSIYDLTLKHKGQRSEQMRSQVERIAGLAKALLPLIGMLAG